jgi:hypothetical protein
MNPIIKAVDEVSFRIPKEILQAVFTAQTYHWRETPPSIDEQIISLVVRPRVMVDCDLVGGTEAIVYLDTVPSQMVDQFVTVYHIPKDKTQGRSITAVLSVGFGSSSLFGRMSAGAANPASLSPLTVAGQAMMDAMSPVPMVSTARCEIIAENTISVRDSVPPVPNSYVRVLVANDKNMSHLQLRSYPAFSKLVELAVKSYIFKELAVKMDQAYLSGGQVLGRFKEIVDGYQDAEDSYQDHLRNVWTKVSMMNDQESMDRFLRLQIGAYR